MRKKLKILIALSAMLLPVLYSGFTEAKETKKIVILKSEGYALSSDSYFFTKIIVYENKNDIPNAIWCDVNGYKGYIYKRQVNYIYYEDGSVHYKVVFSGTLLKGPYVPNRIMEESEK